MPSHANQDDANFLYGSQGHKKRCRPSFWGCRPRRPSSSARARRSGRQTTAKVAETSSTPKVISDRKHPSSASHAQINPISSGRRHISSRIDAMSGGADRPAYWGSPMGHQDYRSPRSAARTRTPWPVMQPFRALVALVKRCPWAFAWDPGARDQSLPDDAYYPSVPRSFLHDTAVSFVIKDHTRHDLPEFVISCPFEHIDHVHQLLAPDGSRRQLSARGTSGQPRTGDQLRSMLLDGTPSIELTLHTDVGRIAAGHDNRQRTTAGNDGVAIASRPEPGDGRDSGDRDVLDDKVGGMQHT